tara:strand:+ start:2698 stop:3576 length:879 start_codon:yes stop_codon:yes gene_type:complete
MTVAYKPLVSVIMNCYNGEEFLSEAINSVLSQTYDNWELIFWDNLSSDKSKEIFSNFKDDRLKYKLSDKHTNLSEARIKAINASQGDLIAFLDVDDFWKEDKLEKQVSLFDDQTIIFSCTSVKVIYENSFKKRNINPPNKINGYIFNELLENYFVVLSSLIVRRLAYFSIGGFEKKYHIIGDFDLVTKLASNGRCGICHEYLTLNRKHSKNESLIKSSIHTKELLDWKSNNAYLLGKANLISQKKIIKNIDFSCILNDISNKNITYQTFLMCLDQSPKNILKIVYKYVSRFI